MTLFIHRFEYLSLAGEAPSTCDMISLAVGHASEFEQVANHAL